MSNTLVKGILSFPTLFTPKPPKGATVPRFDCVILIGPDDPQVAQIQALVEQAKANTFPSGFPRTSDVCFMPYDDKYGGRDYYDARFAGWWVLSATAKQDARPAVVDENRQPVIDPSRVYSGMVAYVSLGIAGYTAGTGGVGGFLNGVMITDEEPPMGRLDNKPTVDQMFANVSTGSAPAPTPAPPPAPVPQKVMTEKAGGVSYEAFIAQGWSDEQLVANGYMIATSF